MKHIKMSNFKRKQITNTSLAEKQYPLPDITFVIRVETI
jgi:chloramphenicol O-acetyltransferase